MSEMQGTLSDLDARGLRSVRMSLEDLAALLDRLDEQSADFGGLSAGRRFSYRISDLQIRLQQPGASAPAPYLAPTRWISASGLAFLYGGYLHRGTLCQSNLATVHGGHEEVDGVVESCRYLAGNLHEVQVLFDHEIDMTLYSPHAVSRRVLLVEPSDMIARMIEFHLGRLNATVERVASAAEAIEAATGKPYELVLIDTDLADGDGFALVADLRQRQYTGRVAALHQMDDSAQSARCLEAGFDAVAAKPAQAAELAKMMNSLHSELLYSTLANDELLAPLIAAFVAELPARIEAIRAALREGSREGLERLVRALAEEGGSYGFERISQAALELEGALVEKAEDGVVQTGAKRLLDLTSRARA
jgi:CheY-like chemotaxis protein